MATESLSPGDKVLSFLGGLRVGAATRSGYSTAVYNLSVLRTHSYVVGRLGAWVHNTGCVTGGSYRRVRGANVGGEVHHMPADSVSPLSHSDGPGILMDRVDHRRTGSWGSTHTAQTYRARQRELLDEGRFNDAVQMDIDDIQSKFGDKYDAAILQMLDAVPSDDAFRAMVR